MHYECLAFSDAGMTVSTFAIKLQCRYNKLVIDNWLVNFRFFERNQRSITENIQTWE